MGEMSLRDAVREVEQVMVRAGNELDGLRSRLTELSDRNQALCLETLKANPHTNAAELARNEFESKWLNARVEVERAEADAANWHASYTDVCKREQAGALSAPNERAEPLEGARWYANAVAERVRRVAAEAQLKQLREACRWTYSYCTPNSAHLRDTLPGELFAWIGRIQTALSAPPPVAVAPSVAPVDPRVVRALKALKACTVAPGEHGRDVEELKAAFSALTAPNT